MTTQAGNGPSIGARARYLSSSESDHFGSPGVALSHLRTRLLTVLHVSSVALFGAWTLAAHAFVSFTGATAIATNAGATHSCSIVSGAIKCWGSNGSGQIGDNSTTTRLTPVAVTGLTGTPLSVAVGNTHTCAIVTGGAVKCWGLNTNGQLGDGTIMVRLTPVAVTGLASGVAAITAGAAHTCALTTGGAVKCWGLNGNGQLGDNSQTQRLTPVSVTGLASGVIAIVAGQNHTCAVTNIGAVKCWGLNVNGQLGDNSQTQRLTPVTATGLTSGATQLAAGNSHTCALVSGGVKCWGLNATGQLGDNSQTQRLTAVDVFGLTSGIAAISAGFQHSCALTTGTGVKCWGNNADGQLGDGTLAFRLTPVDVIGLATGASAVAGGAQHSCALSAGGAVVCWGDDMAGQLGDNATTQRLIPYLVVGQPALKAASTGGLHTCAIVGAGGVKCWGANDSGQLGDNSNSQRLTPVDVVGLANGVVAIVTGASHSCALTTGGSVKCWGDNSAGQLGDNTQTQRLTPVNVSGLASGVKAIAAGDTHTCALTNAGGVKCWGQNNTGQVGDGTSNNQRLTPVDVVGLASGVASIEAGASHTCAVTSGSGAKCWGWNGFGQIGDNTNTQRDTPVDVSGLTSGVSTIAIGQYHSCAMVAGGVKCWGWNDYGQVGDSSIMQRLIPVNVTGLGSGVTGIAAGNGHTCAVVLGGGVKCWGDNTYGQVGDGTSANTRLTPVDVSGPAGASKVHAGGLHTCATIGGGLTCWGLNGNGQLGDNSITLRPTPVDVSGLSALQRVAGGGVHTCALTPGGSVQCWGGNDSGQVGNNSLIRAVAPTSASGLSGATSIATGNIHTCAVVGGGGKCWGDNLNGQLGDGTQTPRLTPVDVSGLSGAVAITASVGSDHTCALTNGGGLKCWGNNGNGQLGDNSTSRRLLPVDVNGLTSGAAAVSAGQFHTCALTATGGVKCWGLNGNGQVGDGTQSERHTPVDVSGLTSGVGAIAAGATHSCALTVAGAVKCWGLNANGQLGDGTPTQRLTAVGVTGLTSGVAAIATGLSHSCALTTGGGVKCWGLNANGQLGDGTITQRLAPVDVSGLTSGVTAIAAGQTHTCALVTNVGVKCWGQNNDGELGDGTAGTRPFPGSVLVVGPATQLAINSVNGGSNVSVGVGFSVVVESRDVGDTPAPAIASTSVALGLVGPGAIGGVTTCTISAGSNTCTATGATIDTAQIGALISANRTSGDALTGGLSSPFDVLATTPGAPTGISAVQTQGGIQVTFTPPVNTGGAPITSYTVTCNPGAIVAVGTASPVLVTGLVNNTPYTCNVRATNSVGSGGVSSPSGSVFYTVAQRTFVASNGNDSSSVCAASAPCRTLAIALVRTLSGGEVIVLDSAPYDVVTLTQPVSILAAAGIFAGISALPGQSAITIAAGPSASVFLRGLVITSEGGNNGILFSSGGALYLENMIVRGYGQVGQVDVNFQPNAAAKLFIKDSRIQSGATGLRIANSGGDIGVTVDSVSFENNGTGIKVSANGQMIVRNSTVVGGSQDGISLAGANALPLTVAFDKLLVSGNGAAGITSGGTLPVFATVSRSTIRGNGGTGIFVSGGAPPSVTRVAQTTIVRNITGVATGAGGTILSRGNNTLEANNADGAFSGTYSGK